MAEHRNIFEIISAEYYVFTPSEKKIADFILANQDGLAYLSIGQLAEGAGVAEATVSRFCRRLGFKNFVEFKLTAANTSLRFKPGNNPLSGQIEQDDTVEDISRKLYSAEMDAIGQTMEVLDASAIVAAADLLEEGEGEIRILNSSDNADMIRLSWERLNQER